ncbi:recombinase family protein [Pedobacter sp. MC2016-05]|uniref:recombinase family protein n=1 Tax=Pedobacter sp. MC2016-05 TaxID=2994474 RepID=UPI003A5221DC
MKIGYARVSNKEQNLNLQIEALEKAGCEIIFRETISGATINNPFTKFSIRAGQRVCFHWKAIPNNIRQ